MDEDGEKTITNLPLASFIVMELQRDKINFQNNVYQAILDEYEKFTEKSSAPDIQFFINHSDPAISSAVIDLLSSRYELSDNWTKKHRINVPMEGEKLKESSISYIYALKLKKVDKMITDNLDALKKVKNGEDEIILIEKHKALMEAKKEFAEKLTRIITR